MKRISLSAKLTEVNFLEKTSEETASDLESVLPLKICEEIVSHMNDVTVENFDKALGL
ncbi:MAG: hypothetical protein ACR5KV_05375 [Wolbachia sp.]